MRETLHLNKPQKEKNVIREDEGLPITSRMKQSFKFVYVHYPKGWFFDLERGFLPNIKKVKGRPGLNGCKNDGSLSLTLAKVQENGGTVLNPKDERLGEFQDYVHFYPVRGGGKYYVDFNREATVLPTNEIIWNKSEQRSTWFDFCLFIRDSGMIRPMLREIYVDLLERERKKRDSLYGRLDRNPHLKTRLEICKTRLEAMEKAWADYSKSFEPKKVSKTPSKRVAKKVTE